MRILLDECVNPRLRQAFRDEGVRTVAEMDWRSLKDGDLLTRAKAAGFDIFVTLDQNMGFQNRVGAMGLALVVLVTRFNDLDTFRPEFARIRDAVLQVKPGEIVRVEIGNVD